jgi:hypothetical protein
MMHERMVTKQKFSNGMGFGLVLMDWAHYSRRFLGASGGGAKEVVESGSVVASDL